MRCHDEKTALRFGMTIEMDYVNLLRALEKDSENAGSLAVLVGVYLASTECENVGFFFGSWLRTWVKERGKILQASLRRICEAHRVEWYRPVQYRHFLRRALRVVYKSWPHEQDHEGGRDEFMMCWRSRMDITKMFLCGRRVGDQ